MVLGVCVLSFTGYAQIEIDGTFVLKRKTTSSLSPTESAQDNPKAEPERQQFRDFEVAPKALNLDSIHKWIGYPEAAQKKGLEGKVIIEVLVSREGRYVKHIVTSSTDPIFTEAVNKRARHLRFTPATREKLPVKAWTRVPFRFQLFK